MSDISLRPYQSEAICAVRADWAKGLHRTIVSMPVGTGKTWIYVFVSHAARARGLRSIVIVNRDELVRQSVEKLGRVGVSAGIVKASCNEWRRDVVVASVQSLQSAWRLAAIPTHRFQMVVVDECHYANAPSYQRVLLRFSSAWMLGMTATPFRGDSASLALAGWEAVSFNYPIAKAVEDGWLVEPTIEKLETSTDLSEVGVHRNPETQELDFRPGSLAKAVDTHARNLAIVGAYKEKLKGRRTLAFTANVVHAVSLANAFRREGIRAEVVHGAMSLSRRRALIADHQRGLYPVLTNCNVLTHGYDDPRIDAIILARPTKSKVLYLQSVGRGLRPSPGKKDCVVLDVVDASEEHDFAITAELAGLCEQLGSVGSLVENAPVP